MFLKLLAFGITKTSSKIESHNLKNLLYPPLVARDLGEGLVLCRLAGGGGTTNSSEKRTLLQDFAALEKL